jgi:hypothetical protein
MKFPKISIEELEESKKKNFEERLKFIDSYVEWLKKTPNKEWSKQQNKIVNKKK